MRYSVFLHPRAAKELHALDEQTRARIAERLKELDEEAERKGRRLVYSDFWSIRIGDYRAIYEIRKDEGRAVVLFIGHRSNVYADFSRLV